MNDPVVVSLRYRVKTSEFVSYNKPPPINIKETDYEMTLENDVLTVKMIEHYPTVGSAMARVNAHLRAWEIQTGLEKGLGHFNFEFESAEMIDRAPLPPGTPTVHSAIANAMGFSIAGAVGHASIGKYPDPPSRFVASSTVEHLWNRYQMYLEGRDLLTTMGYVCLSSLQSDAGGRGRAAAKFCIDRDVLDKLGTLTSDVGDGASARKFDGSSTKRAHTPAEKEWVEAAVKKIIRRVAEHDYDPAAPLSQITMSDLPATVS